MATPSPIPHYAVPCWTDGINVYAEIPCRDGTTYRYSQPYSENGLTKLLHLLRDHEPKGPPAPPLHTTSSYIERQASHDLARRKLAALGLV